jgi:hypothetical protein
VYIPTGNPAREIAMEGEGGDPPTPPPLCPGRWGVPTPRIFFKSLLKVIKIIFGISTFVIPLENFNNCIKHIYADISIMPKE